MSIRTLIAAVACAMTASLASAQKSIVIYFSHAGDNYSVGRIKEGNTKIMADYIVEATGAERFEIVCQKNYDMSYDALCDMAKREKDSGEMPAYRGPVPDLTPYDVVFVGGPIWWGSYPQVVFSFLRDHPEIGSKTLIPFVTHEGSGLGQTHADLQRLFPDAVVSRGLAIFGHDIRNSDGRVKRWAKECIANVK